MIDEDLRANTIVSLLAHQLTDRSVVATGVASALPILAIAVARATHAPNLTYLSCVGSLDPDLPHLHRSTEALQYLEGRRAEVSIADLFDHARRARIDTVFFGAAEIDGDGRTNMSAAGPLRAPKVKFPGVVGASSLRRWVKRPVLLMMRQSRRSLVPAVQVVSTTDPHRRTLVITDLGVFEVGAGPAVLVARHPWTTEATIAEHTGFAYSTVSPLPVTPPPSDASVRAIRSIDSDNHRLALVG